MRLNLLFVSATACQFSRSNVLWKPFIKRKKYIFKRRRILKSIQRFFVKQTKPCFLCRQQRLLPLYGLLQTCKGWGLPHLSMLIWQPFSQGACYSYRFTEGDLWSGSWHGGLSSSVGTDWSSGAVLQHITGQHLFPLLPSLSCCNRR